MRTRPYLKKSYPWSNVIVNLLLSFTLIASLMTDLRRVSSHIKVGDSTASVIEARRVVDLHPNTPISYEMMIKALATTGDLSEMLNFWEKFHEKFPVESMANPVLEEICWGVLREARGANTLSTKLIGIIGAALTQDAYAVDFLISGMRDSNAHLRGISVQLGSLLRDGPLQEEIIHLLHNEKRREVKLEVIKAIGELKKKGLYPDLIEIVEDKKSSAKERGAAIVAILKISDKVERKQLQQLASDKRAGLRQLACESIAKFELKEHADLLFSLVNDANPEVAASALRAVGFLRLEGYGAYTTVDFVKPLAKTLDPTVGVTASWVLLLHDKKAGEEAFSHWIFHEKQHVRAFAASAIASSGKYGVKTALMFLEKTTDPYVRANLALALIGQRVNCDQACAVLDELLSDPQERWMKEEGVFSTLQRSTLTHKPGIPNFPEVVNQTVRLEMLNLLAILDYPGAHDAIHHFLKERRYGVTGLAAETLLGEGDESAIDHVREMLDDPDKGIRLDAALVLATWGRDPSALPVLLEVYPEADRMVKIKILESLGRVGDRSVIPFLIERLSEPSLNLRMVAASVLIQTLNH
ncbi:MAG: hypothetical protein S4CHLAM45_03350 [Chlamydiales bacterium]|nr:hypothetical protein [Chlamydiales bacterium]MCH9619191.1 hypothetical protein [Chlamydiales bacterium]MCH9622453.1 hypothetical protein [Chlamydiales bacterium]